jgi:hypothetical protein
MSDFCELCREKPSSCFMLGCNSDAVASFMKQSMSVDYFARMVVLGKISWPRATLCSAIVDFSGQYNQIMVAFISPHLDGSNQSCQYTLFHICLVRGDLRPRLSLTR